MKILLFASVLGLLLGFSMPPSPCKRHLPEGYKIIKTVHNKFFIRIENDDCCSWGKGCILGKHWGKWSFDFDGEPYTFLDSCSAKTAFFAWEYKQEEFDEK